MFIALSYGFSGFVRWSFRGTQKSQIKMYLHCKFLEESDHKSYTKMISVNINTKHTKIIYKFDDYVETQFQK